MDQIAVTLLGTIVIVVLFSNSWVRDFTARLKLQAALEPVEVVLAARLRHVEEKLSIR